MKRLSLMSLVVFCVFIAQSSFAASRQALNKVQRLKREAVEKGWSFQVGYTPVLERTLQEATGFKKSLKREGMMYMVPTPVAIPKHWDWREQTGGLTPIKDQGQCGSCWAFGTVGALEQAILIKDHKSVNISEQQLVSCNTDGWGCDGGDFAHKYHVTPGAALGADFPYTAQDDSCKQGLTFPYKIQSWAMLGTDGAAPTVDQLKQAIYQYGPISAVVAATDSFMAYTSGIYDANDSQDINHLIDLVGYDDDGGYFILRNSWNTTWGENGYMRIKYGVNAVGSEAAFVIYKPTCQVQPIAITGGEKRLTRGASVELGAPAVPGLHYSWVPAAGLDSPNSAQTLAHPTRTTVYTLRVQSACGQAERSVRVSVN